MTGLKLLKAEGYNSIAIVLMHSYAYSKNEEIIYKLSKDIGFSQVSRSSEVM